MKFPTTLCGGRESNSHLQNLHHFVAPKFRTWSLIHQLLIYSKEFKSRLFFWLEKVLLYFWSNASKRFTYLCHFCSRWHLSYLAASFQGPASLPRSGASGTVVDSETKQPIHQVNHYDPSYEGFTI